jgi:opine dehydrogenase
MSALAFTVIGAGNGGMAMAGHLALSGHDVALYNRTSAHVTGIRRAGGVYLESSEPRLDGFGKLSLVTSSPARAAAHSDILMVVVPSNAHEQVARTFAPHLRDGHIVVLHPGRTLGAVEFLKTLRHAGCEANVTVAEAGTFLYASRTTGPALVKVHGAKAAVPFAALPATRTEAVLQLLQPVYPELKDGGNVLFTGLDNMGCVFHPALAILNSARIESAGSEFQFYIDGATPAVARFLEALDRERVTVAAALNVPATTALDWLRSTYEIEAGSLYEAIQNNTAYHGLKAPNTLDHRYLFEDVPMSLVPIAALGERYGVQTRALQSVIRIASIIHGTDYWRKGRTLDRLGVDGLSVQELVQFTETGVMPDDAETDPFRIPPEAAGVRSDGRGPANSFNLQQAVEEVLSRKD